jgi:hypothetical protein
MTMHRWWDGPESNIKRKRIKRQTINEHDPIDGADAGGNRLRVHGDSGDGLRREEYIG